MPMRNILFSLLLLCSATLSAQTIDNPSFKTRSGSIHNIARIEQTPECTRVYIHAIFRPHWWISVGRDVYLEDAVSGTCYKLKRSEGIELNKETYMPDSGMMDFVLEFEPLAKGTETIHMKDSTDNEGNTYDISLVPEKKKQQQPIERIRGNWYTTDGSHRWAYGVYDSITIADNRVYTNLQVRRKGKRTELTLQEKGGTETCCLTFTTQRDGTCRIQTEGGEARTFTRQKPETPDYSLANLKEPFLRTDTACVQGYIDGYDPRLGFNTGMIYLSNELTRMDYPTVVQIEPDGSFFSKFVLTHPIESFISLEAGNSIPFFIEPGDTLTMYVDWEDLLARSRARDYDFPLKNMEYMGSAAPMAYLLDAFSPQISYGYNQLNKAIKTLTPPQYSDRMNTLAARWMQKADSVSTRHKLTPAATRLLHNKVWLQAGLSLLDYTDNRKYEALTDSTNKVLQIPADDSFYKFLQKVPVDEETALCDRQFDIFINRFEYMQPVERILYQFYESNMQWSDSLKKIGKTDEEVLESYDENLKNVKLKQRAFVEQQCGVSNPLFWQIACLRQFAQELKHIPDESEGSDNLAKLRPQLSHLFLLAEAEQYFKMTYQEGATYQLPEGKATEIFRSIIHNHPNKVLFVDFWATTCGPCRSGIEHSAELRKQYKNHPEFQFIYITNEAESPKKAYQAYVDKHLKGEACYYLSGSDYHYLRQLFRFNGIPHYVLVEKDGSILRKEVEIYNLKTFLEKRFGKTEK